ncbi:MAG TPA: diacylglycerol kinase family protein [Chitinophagaceae bacterium]|nr:diacylglycerol kinase family protein [Chitinophagaceae bacterium]
MFTIKQRIKSFKYAWEGVSKFFLEEHNTILHLLATITMVVLGVFAGVSRVEWLALVIVTGFVWVAEIFNTAIEKMMDHVSTERRPEIKYIKDLSAAGVLIASLVALITGCIVFIPKM